MGEQSTDPLGLGDHELLFRPSKQTLKNCAANFRFPPILQVDGRDSAVAYAIGISLRLNEF